MKHFISAKSLATVALALGAIAVASSAHARSEAHLSVGLPVPGIIVKPMPVLAHPVATAHYRLHNFARRNIVRHWQHRGPYGDYNHNGIANIYDAGRARGHLHHARLHGAYRDFDRDGIRNRFDRRPGNPHRR